MDFGRLLENSAEEERPGSVPPSRSNSRNASSTSLSSLKSSATEKEDPIEVSKYFVYVKVNKDRAKTRRICKLYVGS